MPFPLADLKRSYGRSGTRGAPPDVRPYLLAGKELAAKRPMLEAAIEWFEARIAKARGDVDLDELAALAGDYRLARCLAACLEQRYRFTPESFATAVQDGSETGRRRWSALLERGVDSASKLRLYVFERVAAEHGGFVSPEARASVLSEAGATLGLDASEMDRLLWLDGEEHDRLVRAGARPSAGELAAVYNRRALETLLVRTVSVDLLLPNPDGPAIKRLYFLMKRCGLVADLELAEGGVLAHLFGPLEVFGPRTRHGDRFARAILQLLRWTPGLSGTARVLVNEREYALHVRGDEGWFADEPPAVDEDVAAEQPGEPATAVVAGGEAEGQFDSGVEARLFATLRGMERRGDARGWHVEREPEPLVQDGVVLVPDFLLTQGSAGDGAVAKVFVEVIGFWTPAYRQRKRHKLGHLSGTVPLVLVVQEQLAADFQGLPFPTLTYKQRPSAVDLIRLVDREFGHAEARLRAAAGAFASLQEELSPACGVVCEADVRRRLGLSGADDLRALLGHNGASPGAEPEWQWLPGLGLCHETWLAQIRQVCDGVLPDSVGGAAGLEQVQVSIASSSLNEAGLAANHLEIVLPKLGFEVVWLSLFEAVVRRRDDTE